MKNSKITVITKSDLSTGFRLAGLKVFEVQESKEVKSILFDLYHEGDYALIAIEESLMPERDKKLDKLMEDNPLPVVFPLPKPQTTEKIDQEKYVTDLAKACIGFSIKLK